MYQLDLKLPTMAEGDGSTEHVDVPRVLSRGLLYLALAGSGWLVVLAAVQLLFRLTGHSAH